MLFLRLSLPNIRTQITLPCQWLSVTINTVRLKSNSSSSNSDSSSDSSSDSDRDDRRTNQQINVQKSKKLNSSESKEDDPFVGLISNLLSKPPPKKIDIGITVKDREKKIESQLSKIADKLTTAVGGDKEKILSTLLGSLSLVEKDTEKKKLPKITESIWKSFERESLKKNHNIRQKLLSNNMNIKQEKTQVKQHDRKISDRIIIERRYELDKEKRFQNRYKVSKPKKIEESPKIDDKTKVVDKIPKLIPNNSIIFELLNAHKQSLKMDRSLEADMSSKIFDETRVPDTNVPELKTWCACEERDIKILYTRSPENAFQEMIQWTEEGKLWKFPINNEQGMEKEQSVHFSEHVFLERHLTGWCPTKGPLRHFMELVCVGLSKNPYMTVEEKHEHIMWYKDYFDGKKDLLEQLGLVGTVIMDGGKAIEPQ